MNHACCRRATDSSSRHFHLLRASSPPSLLMLTLRRRPTTRIRFDPPLLPWHGLRTSAQTTDRRGACEIVRPPSGPSLQHSLVRAFSSLSLLCEASPLRSSRTFFAAAAALRVPAADHHVAIERHIAWIACSTPPRRDREFTPPDPHRAARARDLRRSRLTARAPRRARASLELAMRRHQLCVPFRILPTEQQCKTYRLKKLALFIVKGRQCKCARAYA